MVKKVSPEASAMAQQAGRRLRAVQIALGRGVTDLAKAIGVQQNTFSNWMAPDNKRMPDQIAMFRLWQEFRIPMEFIYGGDAGRMEYDLREKVLRAAAEVQAVVGAPIAEFPMQTDHLGRPPAKAPQRRRPPGATLHDPQDPLRPRGGGR